MLEQNAVVRSDTICRSIALRLINSRWLVAKATLPIVEVYASHTRHATRSHAALISVHALDSGPRAMRAHWPHYRSGILFLCNQAQTLFSTR
eukprot:COSAG02_NODE_1984_length_10186_cov_6.109933_6_plen_92_part_00